MYTICIALLHSRVCLFGTVRQNCHTLTLSLGTFDNAPTDLMPAAGGGHCIFRRARVSELSQAQVDR
jgi:hypothetical protein